MVTTRSADRQASIQRTEESLALRSKSDEATSSHLPSDIDTPTRTSSRKSVKISVDVPPRKRTKITYDGTNDVDVVEAQSSFESADLESNHTPASRTEIPDSQESPVKQLVRDAFQAQSDVVHMDSEEPTTRIRNNSHRKRKAGGATPEDAASTELEGTTMATTVAHVRFGSQDPVPEATKDIVSGGIDPDAAQHASSDDDDDAPEVVTTKQAPTGRPIYDKRKQRGKKAVANKKQDAAPNSKPDGNLASGINANGTEQETAKTRDNPSLTVDTTQLEDSTLVPESEDSGDSAFVTARTTRHIDVFATPPGGTPQIKSPISVEARVLTANSMAPYQPPRDRVSSLGSETIRASEISLEPVNSPTSLITLPRKSSSTLEAYRRQVLQTRATKSASGRGNHEFRLQADWPGKRRKFVVAQ